MILRAKWVVPMRQPPVADGAVVVDGDRIVAVGPVEAIRQTHTGAVRDLGEAVLLPGLINAHTHLDYTDFLGQVPHRGSFMDWIVRMAERKQTMTDDQYRAAVEKGLALARAAGTTTLVNVECSLPVITRVDTGGLRVWWCAELLDWRAPRPVVELVQEAVAVGENRDAAGGGFGLAPHALYTASAELYRLSAFMARGRQWLITTHVAESREEDDMFRRGTGLMYERYSRLGRSMTDCKHAGPVQLLDRYGFLGPECLAVHVNCVTPLEVKLLAATQTSVVHCPMTHRFFHRPTPILDALQNAGVNVCLGTDSLASCPGPQGLNLFVEMQELARIFPRMEPARILEMVTVNPARALRRAHWLGHIAPGAAADLVAVAAEGNGIDPYEAAVFNERPVLFSMVNGKVVRG
jgi:cytosine/adenosine deaminase-related metal-dependent hydrolase